MDTPSPHASGLKQKTPPTPMSFEEKKTAPPRTLREINTSTAHPTEVGGGFWKNRPDRGVSRRCGRRSSSAFSTEVVT